MRSSAIFPTKRRIALFEPHTFCMRLSQFRLLASIIAISTASAQDVVLSPDVSSPSPQVVEGFLRREPVIPLALPDYELTTLDISKEIVFHVGNQTFVGKVPIMVYVPVNRSSRASAVDRLVEARGLLLKSAAAKEVTTADLAGLRDLIERALDDLRAVNPTGKTMGNAADSATAVPSPPAVTPSTKANDMAKAPAPATIIPSIPSASTADSRSN